MSRCSRAPTRALLDPAIEQTRSSARAHPQTSVGSRLVQAALTQRRSTASENVPALCTDAGPAPVPLLQMSRIDKLIHLRWHPRSAMPLGGALLILSFALITPVMVAAESGREPPRHHRLARRGSSRRRGRKPCASQSSRRRRAHPARLCASVRPRRSAHLRSARRRSQTTDTNRHEDQLGGSLEPPLPENTGSTVLATQAPADQGPPQEEGPSTLTDPIDPSYLTDVPFGSTSFWLQPWRAYLDTWPASRLADALGINFNVSDVEAEATATLLQDNGFKLARVAINWDALSYDDPTKLVDEAHVRESLEALHNHDLRPLILLDANSDGPGPAKQLTLETTSEAPAGAQSVMLGPSSAAQVVPGKSGFDKLTFGGDPDILITSVGPEGLAVLSRPLPVALAAGAHKGSTLLYAPFGPPRLASGEPNPEFQATLAGWLSYVATVCKEAASIFGPEGYDLEVWNELSFGSQFLNSEYYYSSAGETKPAAMTKEVAKALLDETVAYVRNPANGIPAGVGISDGFASQTPFPSGAQAPVGLTALSKHLYSGVKSFPAEYPAHSTPINALGEPDSAPGERSTPLFIPSYQSLFPEYFLTATSPETIVRDLTPFTTYIYGYPHGREVGPPGDSPVQKWMTEYNLSTSGATPRAPNEVTEDPVTLTTADKEHFEAKALLRSLVSMVSKGMTREYFYAAAPGTLSLISNSFFSALQANPGRYPGDQLGGETMNGFHNMLTQFQGPGPNGPARQLTLLAIAQDGNHAQFAGDGTAAHPSLYDREVLAVFPFQSSPTRFVIPVYVMTRDLLTLYEPNAPSTDIHRFDLPNETFRITLGNLPETTTPPTISAYDPLNNENTPAHLITRNGNTATIEIAATDYPRLLTIDYR